MRLARRAVAVLVTGVVFWSLACRPAEARRCFPTFAYGNVGYSAGYSFTQVGWCGPSWGCRPWGWRRWCPPPVYSYGYGCSYGYGWPYGVGAAWFPSCGSVWMGAPYGGSFFSGAMVPYPAITYPVVVPGFFSSNAVGAPAVATLAASIPAATVTPRTAMTSSDLRRSLAIATSVPRASNAAARLRAARLVATGDRHLREAGDDPTRIRRALDAYRRAATIAADQPDTHIRQAIALLAVGDRVQADAALARAAAIDGRLAAVPPRRPGAASDPVFDGMAAAGVSPAVSRGQAILRQIAAPVGPADAAPPPAVALLATRWAERFGVVDATVARR
ncbi:MAG: hypothetical protein ACKO40_04260 [Planctomycetaceae bacterium]